MVTPILAIVVACFTAGPVQVDMNAPSSNLFCVAKERNVLLIAQKYGAEDPHGADPHGDDPNDEVHDKELPANKEQKANKAPKDVYGGQYPNSQAPY